jgi:hypothetical protein
VTSSGQRPERSPKRRAGYTFLVVAIGVASYWLATRAGMPARLPGVALGSEELLVAERVAATFAILFLAALVLVRAFQGELPQELSGRGVKYANSDAVDELRDRLDVQLEAHDQSLADLEQAVIALETGEPRRDRG